MEWFFILRPLLWLMCPMELGGQTAIIYYCTTGDYACMHSVKKGRRLENLKKIFDLKSKGYRDGKETR